MRALLAARDLALYLLALQAVALAAVGFDPRAVQQPLFLAAWAVLLALALLGSGSVGARLLALIEGAGRGRLRVFLTALHAGLVLLLPLLVAADATLAPRAVALLSWTQAALLLLSASERGAAGAVANAQGLVVLCALRGGAITVIAVALDLALLIAYLTLDRFVRTLGAYPVTRAPRLRVPLRLAARLALPVVAATLAFLALFPPAPHAAARASLAAHSRADASSREIAVAHQVLIFAGLLGGIGVFVVVRLFRKPGPSEPAVVEAVDAEALADEPLPAPEPESAPADGGPRGRIVRVYLRFLREAGRRVARRKPSQTPREFARQLREPAAPLRALTELFMQARYGGSDPGEEDARAAEQAGDAVIAALRRPARERQAG